MTEKTQDRQETRQETLLGHGGYVVTVGDAEVGQKGYWLCLVGFNKGYEWFPGIFKG